MIQKHDIAAGRIAEIGCGAGVVLAEIGKTLPDAKLYGFDIAPDAASFWPHLLGSDQKPNHNHIDQPCQTITQRAGVT